MERIDATGSTRNQRWTFPSLADCQACHRPEAGVVLGFRTHQLNRRHDDPLLGISGNQIANLNEWDFFSPSLSSGSGDAWPKSVAFDDSEASLELRVRSYLDANCAHCHHPGDGMALFDARLQTPLSLTGMIDGPVLYELGIPGARVIAPGHPERSLVRHRLAISGQEQMPPLGRHEVDEEAVEAPTAWIAELGDSGEPMLPVARDDLEVTSYGAPLTFFPMANDGGDGLTIHDVVAAPVHGEVTVSSEGDRMTYVPDAGHSGTDLLSYRVRDALGRVSEPASIRVVTGPEEASAEIRFADESGRLDGGETFSGVAMAVVDMDGDRHDDLVHFDGARELMIDYQIPQNSAFRGVVLGTFGESRVWSVVAGDLDHNGRPELLFGGYREGVRLLNFGENGNQNGGFAMSILENSDVFFCRGAIWWTSMAMAFWTPSFAVI